MENKRLSKTSKIRKIKFVCLKQLEFGLMMSKLRSSLINNMIPYYKVSVNKNDRVSLNIFHEDGYIDVRDIKWVKMTVPSISVEKLNLKNYNYRKKKPKIVKPEQKFYDYPEGKMVGVMLPIEIFNNMITSSSIRNENSLSYLIDVAVTADSIKLLDKDRKLLAYALPDIDF